MQHLIRAGQHGPNRGLARRDHLVIASIDIESV